MPASKQHRTPSYRLHRPSGQAVVTLNDKDIYLGRYDSQQSRAEYDRLIAEWLTSGRRLPGPTAGSTAQPTAGSKPDVTVNEIDIAYLRHADNYYRKPDGRPTSEPECIRLALRPLRQLYGHTFAKDFGPLALKTVRQAMIESELCRNEVNKRISKIVRAFKWAVGEELIPPSVYQGLNAVTGLRRGRANVRESEPVRPVPDAFVDAIRPFVARQVWTMVELQRLTGMRPGEVTNMRSCDIDTVGKIWVYTPSEHKTEHHGKERRVYLGPQAQTILKPWLRVDLSAYLFSPREAMEERKARLRENRKTKVQPSQLSRAKPRPKKTPGQRYDTDSYRRAIDYGCKRAGVPKWHPHRLRHSAATRLRREFGLDVTRAVLGHSSPAVTQLYAELDRTKAAEAMERVG
jgi:integrase